MVLPKKEGLSTWKPQAEGCLAGCKARGARGEGTAKNGVSWKKPENSGHPWEATLFKLLPRDGPGEHAGPGRAAGELVGLRAQCWGALGGARNVARRSRGGSVRASPASAG